METREPESSDLINLTKAVFAYPDRITHELRGKLTTGQKAAVPVLHTLLLPITGPVDLCYLAKDLINSLKDSNQ